jgi:hypothetical protein
VNNRQRRSYKAWQEGGKLPSFILEVTSMTTRKQDEVEKPRLYARLGVEEYFQYDPTADYLKPQLKGRRLVNGEYQPLPLEATTDGTPFIYSAVLGLDLRLLTPTRQALGIAPLPKELRFFDPQTGQKLLSRDEVEQERELVLQERDLAQQQAERLAQKLRELGVDPESL